MTLYSNFREIKQYGDREKEINALLQTPGIPERIEAIAATLADTFKATTKLIIDIHPGAVFIDNYTKIEYTYVETSVPFDIGSLNELMLIAAQQPYEELQDQGYFVFREYKVNGNKVLQGTAKRNIMGLKDFIKLVSIGRFAIVDYNVNSNIDVEKALNI